jgi:hypothetical protein
MLIGWECKPLAKGEIPANKGMSWICNLRKTVRRRTGKKKPPREGKRPTDAKEVGGNTCFIYALKNKTWTRKRRMLHEQMDAQARGA